MTINDHKPTPQRPRTRGECPPVDAELGWRLCPWAGCRHHLYLDVLNGQVVTLDGDLATLARERPMCALDVADNGGQTDVEHNEAFSCSLREIGALLDMSHQRVQQILNPALGKVRRDDILRIHAEHRDQPTQPLTITSGADLRALIDARGLQRNDVSRMAGVSLYRITGATGHKDVSDWQASQWHTAIAIAHALGYDLTGSGADYEHARECWRRGVDAGSNKTTRSPGIQPPRKPKKSSHTYRQLKARKTTTDTARRMNVRPLSPVMDALGITRKQLAQTASISQSTAKIAYIGGTMYTSSVEKIAAALRLPISAFAEPLNA